VGTATAMGSACRQEAARRALAASVKVVYEVERVTLA